MSRPLYALYSGSFDPIHLGHEAVVRYIASLPGIDGVLLSVSPMNPLKEKSILSDDALRMEMACAAISGIPHVGLTDIELSLPRPSYSLKVLEALSERYPDRDFRLVIGADNWLSFNAWASPDEIIRRYGLLVVPRPGFPVQVTGRESEIQTIATGVTYLPKAPMIDISSTDIRRRVAKGESIDGLVSPAVARIMSRESLWKCCK